MCVQRGGRADCAVPPSTALYSVVKQPNERLGTLRQLRRTRTATLHAWRNSWVRNAIESGRRTRLDIGSFRASCSRLLTCGWLLIPVF